MRNRDDFKTQGIRVTSHPRVVLCNSNYFQDLITYRASIFREAIEVYLITIDSLISKKKHIPNNKEEKRN